MRTDLAQIVQEQDIYVRNPMLQGTRMENKARLRTRGGQQALAKATRPPRGTGKTRKRPEGGEKRKQKKEVWEQPDGGIPVSVTISREHKFNMKKIVGP